MPPPGRGKQHVRARAACQITRNSVGAKARSRADISPSWHAATAGLKHPQEAVAPAARCISPSGLTVRSFAVLLDKSLETPTCSAGSTFSQIAVIGRNFGVSRTF